MTNYTVLRRAALTCAGLAAAALAACGSSDSGSSGMPGTDHSSGNAQPAASSSQPSANANGTDYMFAQMMIPHHQQAVEMADLAATRAASPQVKQLAAQIKAAQAPEIETMTKWLTAWGQPTTAPSSSGMANMPSMSSAMPGTGQSMPGMMSDADMAKLKAASGKEFDKQFLQMMIGHHQGAIQMARTEQSGGVYPDAKALAGRIITTQQAEIDSIQKMLTQS